MPRRKFIDKKNATTFALVHRAQNDPLIDDESAPPMVFTETSGPSTQSTQPFKSRKVKERGDLEDEFGVSFKQNEGEAAEHGVFYDDTQYDYMQHMRDLGSGGGEVAWVEAPVEKTKGKGKMKLADALRSMDIAGDAQSEGGLSHASSASLLSEDALGSEFVKKKTYQDMQDVPDVIAGFQPDMDPRLREALEALEDEAYVDDEEEDFFAELAEDGEEIDEDEFEMTFFDEEADGYESDRTIKADDDSLDVVAAMEGGQILAPPTDTAAPPPADPAEGAWMEEFSKFKKDVKAAKAPVAAATPSDLQSSVHTGLSSLASGRRKKRKGALTSTTNYSMTSSALHRTDAQTLLDARFDKIAEAYAEDADDDAYSNFDDSASLASGMTGMTGASRASKASNVSGMSRASGISSYSRATDSEAPQLLRSDFDSIMDGFLGGHSKAGKRHIKKSGFQTGMEQLDEIRSGLGPARFKAGKT